MAETGFVKAQSDNLPKIDMFMMSTYFASNSDFTAAELRGVKATSIIIVNMYVSAEVPKVKHEGVNVAPPDRGWCYIICISVAICFVTVSVCGSPLNKLLITLVKEADPTFYFNVNYLSKFQTFCFGVACFFGGLLSKVTATRRLALIAAFLLCFGIFCSAFVYHGVLFFILIGVFQSSGKAILYILACKVFNDFFLTNRICYMFLVQTITTTLDFAVKYLFKNIQEIYNCRGSLILLSALCTHTFIAAVLMHPTHFKQPQKSEGTILLMKHKGAISNNRLTPVATTTLTSSDLISSSRLNGSSKFFKQLCVKEEWCWLRKFLQTNASIGLMVATFVKSYFMVIFPEALISKGYNDVKIKYILRITNMTELATKIIIIGVSLRLKIINCHEFYLIGLSLGLISKLGMLWSKTEWIAITSFGIEGVSRSIITVLSPLVVSEVVSPERFAPAMGFYMMLCSIIDLTAGPALNKILEFTSNFTTILYILTSLYATVIMFWSIELMYKRGEHKREQRWQYLENFKKNKK